MSRKIVVDASVAAKWVFPENDSQRALVLRDGYQDGSFRLLAPEHFLAELANLAWKKSALRGEITPDEARQSLEDVVACCPSLSPLCELVTPALALAQAYRRSVYDSLYIALALHEQCEFVTADQKLVGALNLPWVVSLKDWRK